MIPGGIEQYIGKSGISNIEFEAGLIHDMMELVNLVVINQYILACQNLVYIFKVISLGLLVLPKMALLIQGH